MSECISVTETARLIRAQLKKQFPDVKFSVRSSKYAGGASIDISWTDGPTRASVEQITGPFSGAGFDGMVDMKYCKDSYLLPDGTAQFAGTRGTEGAGGVDPKEHNMMPAVAGVRRVRFGADYVFCSRNLSAAFRANVRQQWEQMDENERAALMRKTEAWRAACPIPQSWEYDATLSAFGSEAEAVFTCIARQLPA